MRTEKREVYITADGREFTERAAAEKHEITLELTKFIDASSDIYWRDTNPAEIAEWLVNRASKVVAILTGGKP